MIKSFKAVIQFRCPFFPNQIWHGVAQISCCSWFLQCVAVFDIVSIVCKFVNYTFSKLRRAISCFARNLADFIRVLLHFFSEDLPATDIFIWRKNYKFNALCRGSSSLSILANTNLKFYRIHAVKDYLISWAKNRKMYRIYPFVKLCSFCRVRCMLPVPQKNL